MKKSVESAWLPHRRSWLKAVLLALLMTAITDILRIIGSESYIQARVAHSPEPAIVLGIAILLLPIPAIAFAHHFFLNRLAPTPQSSEIVKKRGFLPRLASWWEGLYGWLALVLSTLITTLTCTLLLPLFNLSYEKIRLGENRWGEIELLAWLAVIWIGSAAELYHIEYLVKRYLFTVNSVRSKASNSSLNIALKTEPEYNPFHSGLDLLPLQTEITNAHPTSLGEEENGRSHKNQAKKLIIPLSLVLLASGIYGFAKWSEIQGISLPFGWESSAPKSATDKSSLIAKNSGKLANPITSETPLPVPYAPPVVQPTIATIQAPPPSAQFDPFQQAVYKATTAANLTQLAKSRAEWNAIARQWEDAISLMKAVPPSSPKYELAQTKASEYQQNLSYALKAAATRLE